MLISSNKNYKKITSQVCNEWIGKNTKNIINELKKWFLIFLLINNGKQLIKKFNGFVG